jgi:ubiquinone biosynthesis protein UbiJ
MPAPNDPSQIDITRALALLGESWADASPGEIIRTAIQEIQRLRDQVAELQAQLERAPEKATRQ